MENPTNNIAACSRDIKGNLSLTACRPVDDGFHVILIQSPAFLLSEKCCNGSIGVSHIQLQSISFWTMIRCQLHEYANRLTCEVCD